MGTVWLTELYGSTKNSLWQLGESIDTVACRSESFWKIIVAVPTPSVLHDQATDPEEDVAVGVGRGVCVGMSITVGWIVAVGMGVLVGMAASVSATMV